MRKSDTAAFVDETDLVTIAAPAPATEPDYWLQTYPVLTEALADTEPEAGYGPQEVALDLAIIVSVRADNNESLADGDALSIFLDGAIS